jgi:opacity protein-like surface antigen
MNHQTLLVTLALFAVGAVPYTAHAQSPVEAGAGWVISASGGLAVDEDGDVSPAAGVAAAYPLTRNVAVEGELAHAFDVAPADSGVDSSVTSVHGSMLYFFTTPFTTAPYVAAGIGIATFSHEVMGSPSDDRTEIGFNFGGGLTHPLSDRVWARGDVRVFRHIDDVPLLWRFTGALTIRLSP